MNLTQESAWIMFIFWIGDLGIAIGNYYKYTTSNEAQGLKKKKKVCKLKPKDAVQHHPRTI